MNKISNQNEENARICELLSVSGEEGMNLMFDTYYKSLVLWADTFLCDIGRAEDLVQDFFVSLWHRKTYLQLKADTLTSFLYVSVRNRCYNAMQKQDVFRHIKGLEQIDLVFEEYNRHHDAIINCVLEEMGRLPERSREIMHDVFVEGLKYREVAERYHISVSTVKTLVGNALRRLRENLSKEMFLGFLVFFFSNDEQTEILSENSFF